MEAEAQTNGVKTSDQAAGKRRGLFGIHQIPNTLCVLRVILVFISVHFLIKAYLEEHRLSYFWLTLITMAALTDKLDGWLAKRYGWVSELGGYLDHISDKMVTMALFVFLVRISGFPVWALSLLVFRELFVTGMRTVGNGVDLKVATSMLGRTKTFVQQVAAFLIITNLALPHDIIGFAAPQWALWIGVSIFWGVVLMKGAPARSWLKKAYSVELPDGSGGVKTSYKDYYLAMACYLLMYGPLEHFVVVVVLGITCGSQITYLLDFISAAREKMRTNPDKRRRITRISLYGNLVNLLLSSLLSVFLFLMMSRHGSSFRVLWALILGFSFLWAVFLMINYLTTPSRSKPS